ncbi:Tyrosine-protein kinase EpsD [hydrothermal vent metagenome]|uniref:non-specific protein-tyrosine kinase n=1 Tax=hydrothermal vent metagenome TaxID=652676 RepID=A0A1W1BD61_9ZZZZ
MHQYREEEKVNIVEVSKTIKSYKWSIFMITLLFSILTYIFLSFQHPVYSSYAIVKIKDISESSNKNLILKSNFSFKEINVKEDITLLKTFYINNKALELNRVNFKVQYYNRDYKGREIYKQIPINVSDIKILDRSVLGKKITLISKKDGYSIQFKYSSIEKIKSTIFGKSLHKIESQLFKYGEKISTKYFSLKVNKLSNFTKPIDIVINGDYRYIYEHIIKNNLDISQIEDEVPLIKISYKDNIQERATKYIDSLTDSFIKESIKNKSEQNNKILQFITHELDTMKSRLDKSEKELERYRVSNKVVQPSEQAKIFIRELSNIEISLSENHLKESLVQNLMKFIKGNYNLDSVAPSLMELNDKPTLELIGVLQSSQLTKGELLSDFTFKHPKVIAIEKKINTIRKKIISNIQNIQRHISQKNENLKSLKASYEEKLKKLPTKERKLINIKRDYEVSSKMYNFLLEKQAENEIAKVATLSNYKVIDRAYGSSSPIGTSHNNILLAFTILGMILGIILAFIRDALNNKIRYIEDIETHTDIPIYGNIPFLKEKEVKLEVYHNSNTAFTESYRTLRTNLQLEEFQVILVTSTVDDEGKNITTANLSAIFEIANYKTIAIDLDMRLPTLDILFNIHNVSVGISSYLLGESNLNEIIYPTPYSSLNVIPVGEIPSNPSELVLSNRLPKLIEKLKKEYDYIIINSVPIGAVTDTKHIMRFSDINLVLFREEYSKKSYLSNLNRIAKQKKFKKMGIVFMRESNI